MSHFLPPAAKILDDYRQEKEEEEKKGEAFTKGQDDKEKHAESNAAFERMQTMSAKLTKQSKKIHPKQPYFDKEENREKFKETLKEMKSIKDEYYPDIVPEVDVLFDESKAETYPTLSDALEENEGKMFIRNEKNQLTTFSMDISPVYCGEKRNEMNEITGYNVASAQRVAEYSAKKFLSEHFLTQDGKYMFPVKMHRAGDFEYSNDPTNGLHIAITHKIYEKPIRPHSRYMVKKHYYFIDYHESGQPPEYKGVKSAFSKVLTPKDSFSLYPTGYAETYPDLFVPDFAKSVSQKKKPNNKKPFFTKRQDLLFRSKIRDIYEPFMKGWGSEIQLNKMVDLSEILNNQNSNHFNYFYFKDKFHAYNNGSFDIFTANDYIKHLESMVDEKRGGRSRKRGQNKTKKRRGQKKSK
jgi:hypothetical protein